MEPTIKQEEPKKESTLKQVFDPTIKRIKKAKPKESDSKDAKPEVKTEQSKDYSYQYLLKRIFDIMKEKNKELLDSKKATFPPPDIQKVGGLRCAWVNFQETCDKMNRDPQHVMLFMSSEYNTDCNIGGEDQLILRGRYTNIDIEKTIKKYIMEYVQCASCKCINTTLNKDPTTRAYYMNCNACQSMRTVLNIKAGFHAMSKGERRAQK